MPALVSDFQFPWAAGWAFSQAVRSGEVIVTAGQAGFDDDGQFVGDDFEAQFRQAFRNLDRVLRTQGSSLDGVMRLNTYLSDASQYEAFKRIRELWIPACAGMTCRTERSGSCISQSESPDRSGSSPQ